MDQLSIELLIKCGFRPLLVKVGIPAEVLKQLFASQDIAHLVRFLVFDNEFVRKLAAQYVPLDEN